MPVDECSGLSVLLNLSCYISYRKLTLRFRKEVDPVLLFLLRRHPNVEQQVPQSDGEVTIRQLHVSLERLYDLQYSTETKRPFSRRPTAHFPAGSEGDPVWRGLNDQV